MKKRIQFVLFPDPLQTLPDAQVQLSVANNKLEITGMPNDRKLDYIMRSNYDGGDLWYVTYELKRPKKLTGAEEYNEFKTSHPILLIGRSSHLKNSTITRYSTFLGLQPSLKIGYRLGGWSGEIEVNIDGSFDREKGRKRPLEIIASVGKLASESSFALSVLKKN